MVPRKHGKQPWATPFIITRNSAAWLSSILRVYRSAGMNPRVLFDASTDDDTESVLRSWGVRYRRVIAPAPRVEALVAEIAKDQSTGWALRMDDDEVPSQALVDFIHGPAPPDDVAAVALSRWFLQRSEHGDVLRARWAPETWLGQEMKHDWQWRIFRPDAVTYTDEIHSPGFIKPTNFVYGPDDAAIAHLVWIVRTKEERKEKLSNYDSQKQYAGSFFAKLYIPEDVPNSELAFEPAPSGEFDRVVADISRMRGRLARLWRFRHRVAARLRRPRNLP